MKNRKTVKNQTQYYVYTIQYLYMFIVRTHTQNTLRRTNWKEKDTNRLAVVNYTYGFWIAFIFSFRLLWIVSLSCNKHGFGVAAVNYSLATSGHNAVCFLCILLLSEWHDKLGIKARGAKTSRQPKDCIWALTAGKRQSLSGSRPCALSTTLCGLHFPTQEKKRIVGKGDG